MKGSGSVLACYLNPLYLGKVRAGCLLCSVWYKGVSHSIAVGAYYFVVSTSLLDKIMSAYGGEIFSWDVKCRLSMPMH